MLIIATPPHSKYPKSLNSKCTTIKNYISSTLDSIFYENSTLGIANFI
jgi:hypothetical protein